MWLAKVARPPGRCDYQLHQYLFGYFPPMDKREFLFRVAGQDIFVLSLTRPSVPAVRIQELIQAGQSYAFDLLCNPVKQLGARPGRALKRIVVRDFDGQRDWLAARLEGCEIRFSHFQPQTVARFRNSKGEKVQVYFTRATGVLTVQDKTAFLLKLQAGIGRARAWGCGLLMLPEVFQCRLS